MFDTIGGLPLHPLLVHGTVVLLPIAAIATAVIAFRPAWGRFIKPLAVVNGVVMLMTFATMESGEALEHRVEQLGEQPGLHEHAEWGERLFFLSLALFVGSLVMYFVRSRPGVQRAVAIGAAIGAVAVIGVAVVTGHSGATLVWQSIVENTNAGGD